MNAVVFKFGQAQKMKQESINKISNNLCGILVNRFANKERGYALFALAVFIVAEGVSTLKFSLTRDLPYGQIALLSSLEALVFWWILPVVIIYKIERKNWRSLGMAIQRTQLWIYLLAAALTLVIPALLFGVNRVLLIEFVEQIVYIGFIEELFYRGYLLRRMCNWLGNWRGLLMTSLLFGLGHIISRLAQHGFDVLGPASFVGLQTFLGGLLFGFVFIKAGNIWPSAIIHVSMNMYLGRVIELFR